MKNSFVLDASALLVLINQESGYEKVSDYLQESCMSAVNVSEVASVLNAASLPREEIESIVSTLITTIVPFDEELAYETANLRKETRSKGLSLGDRACLALGKLKNISVVTADKVWTTLDIGVKVILIR